MRTMWTSLISLTFLTSIVHAQDRCALEPDPGPCRAKATRYFYNPQTQSCEGFIYGGCQGVVPFETLSECENAGCAPCRQKPDAGPCKGRFKRFFFHIRRGTCEPFIWGGCNGTVPFEDVRECEMASCVQEESPRRSPGPLATRCDLEPERGPCLKDRTKWYWDGAMQSFKYGGCLGRVPFRNEEQCKLANCGGGAGGDDDMGGDSGPGNAICRAKPDPGPCEGEFPRWYYNADKDSCESFLYGGCKGSAPFATRTECEASDCIQNRCMLEPERGPCDEDLTRYYFNQETGQCDSFSYGGCFGVVPYTTESSCTAAKCNNEGCGLLPKPGNCDKNVTRWWYDTTRGECTQFSWSGCGGVVPFNSKKECRNAKCERDVCKLIPESGVCRAFFQRYFWNQEFKRCESFIWGGCGGVVPFESETECENALCAGADFGNNDNRFSMA